MHLSHVTCDISHVTCDISHVMCHSARFMPHCHVSHVTCQCHLSLTPTATVTDPPPANSPTMPSMLICKDPKTQKINLNTKNHGNCKNKNMSRGMPILAILSSTRSLKLKPFGRNRQIHVMGQTNIATLGRFCEKSK